MFSRKTVKVTHSDRRRPGCEGLTQKVEVSHSHHQRWAPLPVLVRLVRGVLSGCEGHHQAHLYRGGHTPASQGQGHYP